MSLKSLSMAQLIKLKRDEGVRFLSMPRPKGQFTVIIRDIPTQKIITKVQKTNMITRGFYDQMIAAQTQTGNSQNVFLSNETDAIKYFKTIYRATYRDTAVVLASATINNTSKTWTYTVSFSAPTSGYTRDFQIVGIASNTAEENATGARTIRYVWAATRLSAMLTQTDTQTVEISYRVAFERV